LVNCIGAIYLISPKSINRNWINFELGAVWIRNAINLRNNEKEIPTLPMCHSGIEPSSLPSPINNLNAVRANEPAGLTFALKSLQAAVGGKGTLKSNIPALVEQVSGFEKKYTIDANVLHALEILGMGTKHNEIRNLIRADLSNPSKPDFADFGNIVVEGHLAPVLYDFAAGPLKGILIIESKGNGSGQQGGRPVVGPFVGVKFLFATLTSVLMPESN
jgi:hypothetical protein